MLEFGFTPSIRLVKPTVYEEIEMAKDRLRDGGYPYNSTIGIRGKALTIIAEHIRGGQGWRYTYRQLVLAKRDSRRIFHWTNSCGEGVLNDFINRGDTSRISIFVGNVINEEIAKRVDIIAYRKKQARIRFLENLSKKEG